eukprot:4164007-Amphidinium_carterae.2
MSCLSLLSLIEPCCHWRSLSWFWGRVRANTHMDPTAEQKAPMTNMGAVMHWQGNRLQGSSNDSAKLEIVLLPVVGLLQCKMATLGLQPEADVYLHRLAHKAPQDLETCMVLKIALISNDAVGPARLVRYVDLIHHYATIYGHVLCGTVHRTAVCDQDTPPTSWPLRCGWHFSQSRHCLAPPCRHSLLCSPLRGCSGSRWRPARPG